jgi:hypothetical protein
MTEEFYDEILRRAVRFHLFTLRQCLQQASLGQTAKQNLSRHAIHTVKCARQIKFHRAHRDKTRAEA